jgi:hypothetical protein
VIDALTAIVGTFVVVNVLFYGGVYLVALALDRLEARIDAFLATVQEGTAPPETP